MINFPGPKPLDVRAEITRIDFRLSSDTVDQLAGLAVADKTDKLGDELRGAIDSYLSLTVDRTFIIRALERRLQDRAADQTVALSIEVSQLDQLRELSLADERTIPAHIGIAAEYYTQYRLKDSRFVGEIEAEIKRLEDAQSTRPSS